MHAQSLPPVQKADLLHHLSSDLFNVSPHFLSAWDYRAISSTSPARIILRTSHPVRFARWLHPPRHWTTGGIFPRCAHTVSSCASCLFFLGSSSVSSSFCAAEGQLCLSRVVGIMWLQLAHLLFSHRFMFAPCHFLASHAFFVDSFSACDCSAWSPHCPCSASRIFLLLRSFSSVVVALLIFVCVHHKA